MSMLRCKENLDTNVRNSSIVQTKRQKTLLRNVPTSYTFSYYPMMLPSLDRHEFCLLHASAYFKNKIISINIFITESSSVLCH